MDSSTGRVYYDREFPQNARGSGRQPRELESPLIKLLGWVVCTLISYVLGRYLPPGTLATYAPLMVSYHLFLVFLLLTADQKRGFSLSIGETLVSHLACLGILFGFTFGREYIPFADIIRYFIPSLAPFEVQWLFRSGTKNLSQPEQLPHTPDATAEEYREFIQYLRQKDRRFRKPGSSVHDEFVSWLAHNGRKHKGQAAESFPSPRA